MTSNVDSTQLQDVAIDHNIQVEQTKENCEKPCLVILFTSWGMNWICLACYYTDASTSLWHINFLWFIRLCCRELAVQQGIRERSVTNELQHKWKEMAEAYLRHCPSRSMKGLRKTIKNFCYRSWHLGLSRAGYHPNKSQKWYCSRQRDWAH